MTDQIDFGTLPPPVIPLERTFEGFLDLEWLELGPDSTHVRLAVRDNLKQPLGLLHGGIYCSVAETVASVATVKEVFASGRVGSGLSNTASFLRPVTEGVVDVTGRLRHRSETEWVWAHDFRDAKDRLCALVDVIIAVRPIPGGEG